jgi:hypothetical protein
MDSKEFSYFRSKIKKTQKEMAELLGTSLKAVHSYEQGWRKVPVHVERQLLFLASRMDGKGSGLKHCWEIRACPPERKDKCPAWQFRSGTLCWFVNGTFCCGVVHKNWHEKMKVCRSCEVFTSALPPRPEKP